MLGDAGVVVTRYDFNVEFTLGRLADVLYAGKVRGNGLLRKIERSRNSDRSYAVNAISQKIGRIVQTIENLFIARGRKSSHRCQAKTMAKSHDLAAKRSTAPPSEGNTVEVEVID